MPQSRPDGDRRISAAARLSEMSANSAGPSSGRNMRTRRVSRDRSRRFALGLVAIMTMVSLLLGWGLARWAQATPLAVSDVVAQAATEQEAERYRTVDYVPEGLQLGQRLYLENCATCHIGVPPQTLPSEAWRNLIQDSSHYGSEIRPPQDPSLGLIWTYLRAFSRQKSAVESRVPYRLRRSRYFKALHPDVTLPQEVSLDSCASCHRAAQQFSFRPWEESPGSKP